MVLEAGVKTTKVDLGAGVITTKVDLGGGVITTTLAAPKMKRSDFAANSSSALLFCHGRQEPAGIHSNKTFCTLPAGNTHQ